MDNLRDPEAVDAVLGSIISRGAEVLGDAIATGLEPQHLPDERDRLIYRAMIALAAAGKSIDLVTVRRQLKEAGGIDTVGDAYLAELGAGIPVDIDVTPHAQELVRLANVRKLLTATHDTHEAIRTGSDLQAAIAGVESALVAYHANDNKGQHQFEALAEDRYRLTLPEVGTVIEVDRLRREHSELQGELCVKCTLPGVKTFDGTVSIADFNLSSARARTERAKLLGTRSGSKAVDWAGALEELCQRVLAAERQGNPSVDLRTLERPGPDDSISVDGLTFPRRHPTVLFGDGGSAKSYISLYILGTLAKRGMRVALFDWELAGEDHRDRLERLFGSEMPPIEYAHCERPLTFEVDRLARIVRDKRIDFAAYDSVVFACDGPPESAEVAARYFRAVRQIGVGGLHVAHITKSDSGDMKPFGSVFFHNSARATYFCKLADASGDGESISIGLYARKNNLSKQCAPIGYRISFTGDRTAFVRSNPNDTPELAGKMTYRERMYQMLRFGSLPVKEVADRLGTDVKTVRKTARRHPKTFTLLENGYVALLQ
ncbi:MAG: DnaB-like helicase N-terminal domain-containing protein [Acidobacteriota bacterium]|nr:DnaB-like helicase N-terminal domain-containing protein [Acidobacteriota bacterium]